MACVFDEFPEDEMYEDYAVIERVNRIMRNLIPLLDGAGHRLPGMCIDYMQVPMAKQLVRKLLIREFNNDSRTQTSREGTQEAEGEEGLPAVP